MACDAKKIIDLWQLEKKERTVRAIPTPKVFNVMVDFVAPWSIAWHHHGGSILKASRWSNRGRKKEVKKFPLFELT